MTALKPIENRNVRGVASERYPLNIKCAHPECNEDAVDPHHCFPRSAIGNDSWFVLVIESTADERFADMGVYDAKFFPIPHVAGLCRAHHDDVEEHRAWIKLEEGVFVWYDRNDPHFDREPKDGVDGACHVWVALGPLNPQPGSREGKPKRKKFKGEKRRQRTTISVKVPKDDQEDGAGVWEDTLEAVRAKLVRVGAISADDAETYPPYNTIILALQDWLTD